MLLNKPNTPVTFGAIRRWRALEFGQFIMGAALKFTSCDFFSNAAPLLEEEGHTRVLTLVANGEYPSRLHRSRAWAALATNDHPVNTGEVDLSEVLEQWFDG